MAKPRQLKPWPDLTGILPLLKAEELKLKTNEVGHIDMENVYDVDALGLAIYLAKLKQITSDSKGALLFSPAIDDEVISKLDSLSFYDLLRSICEIKVHQDLFSLKNDPVKKVVPLLSGDVEKIIHIRCSSGMSREQKISEIKIKLKNFLNLDVPRRFAHEQVMVVLLELVKNTLDHSHCDAFLGLQIKGNKFRFNYADTGGGVAVSVRKFLFETSIKTLNDGKVLDSARLERLAVKGGFADFIQWALKPGNSTKLGNGINFGFGLMMIVEASKNCGVRLAIRDADTYLVLTHSNRNAATAPDQGITHTLIRQRGVTTNGQPLLLFHGDLILEK
jgi:hypothetical protein